MWTVSGQGIDPATAILAVLGPNPTEASGAFTYALHDAALSGPPGPPAGTADGCRAQCQHRNMVELRDATLADAYALATVQTASWRAAYRGLMPDDVLAGLSVPELEQRWSDRLTAQPARTSVVVAAKERQIVGFAAVGPPVDPADRADSTLGDLYALYLDPENWGRGIGTALHDTALDRLVTHSFTHAGLWVLDGNQRAQRFYHRHGWTDTGRMQIDRGPQNIELHERRLHRSLTS
ncbi:N-acetyltransferase family protein [Pseudonocardia sichuanensis]